MKISPFCLPITEAEAGHNPASSSFHFRRRPSTVYRMCKPSMTQFVLFCNKKFESASFFGAYSINFWLILGFIHKVITFGWFARNWRPQFEHCRKTGRQNWDGKRRNRSRQKTRADLALRHRRRLKDRRRRAGPCGDSGREPPSILDIFLICTLRPGHQSVLPNGRSCRTPNTFEYLLKTRRRSSR